MSRPQRTAFSGVTPRQVVQHSAVSRPAQQAGQVVQYPTPAAQAPLPTLPSCRSIMDTVDVERKPGIYILSPPHMPAAMHGAYFKELRPGSGLAFPKLNFVHFADENMLYAYFKAYGNPEVYFEWPGYRHLNRRYEVQMPPNFASDGCATVFIRSFIKYFEHFVRNLASEFQGPGIRIGPQDCPVDNVRLRSLYLTNHTREPNKWRAEVGCLLYL